MKRLLAFLLLTGWSVAAEVPYDFRTSDAYGKLSATDKQRLEQVHRDMVLLWGALDMYADEHDGNLPANLDELTPKYLTEVPSDPFSTPETAKTATPSGYTQSKKGMGYLFKRGARGNRAWVISSVGLPGFPYRGKGSGLYICKGTWIGGINPLRSK